MKPAAICLLAIVMAFSCSYCSKPAEQENAMSGVGVMSTPQDKELRRAMNAAMEQPVEEKEEKEKNKNKK